ncbi:MULTISPECIES: hypothetical protein [Halobacterium]|uniref:hypothetical protein n=1 Tax=Halobacterium TaxID=2239 RepID=UPI001962414E|nr:MULTISPECIES: hypothetical protein [Halobacterium]MCF2165729.1 hypothetical protein [Halobacterium salinarum]MCF2166599.1 hypothetical protein [Halobacterium salinarum]MDL0121351.1 hypothetical protein [Halobacterium salinarum]MDL0127462.1 hypothetical protein [Halobacterium salinarum]MDL0132534.1 hypothetical protein [Halobacterium salinarum]
MSRSDETATEPATEPAADDTDRWRCEDCGAVQRTPEPPCERCWGTTLSPLTDAPDDGARGTQALLGHSPPPQDTTTDTPPRLAHVTATSTRTAVVAGGGALCLGGLATVVSGTPVLASIPLLALLLWAGTVVAAGIAVLGVAIAAAAFAAAHMRATDGA